MSDGHNSKGRQEMATKMQALTEHVDAMIRRDGGPLVEVEFIHRNGKHGTVSYEPTKAYRVQRELERNGATIIAVRQIR